MGHPLAVCLAGHVDHGKSSLLGRLLHELDLLPEGKVAKLEAASASRGVPLEWSFALDALQLERDQAVTLDTTRVHVRTPKRELIVIDCPGHRELVRNLVTGAAGTSAALLVVDAQAGAEAQTRAHAALLRLLGIQNFVVAVKKMDALGWSEARINARRDEIAQALAQLGVVVHAIVPTSARDGGNIATPAEATWWRGPTLVSALEALPDERTASPDAPLRLPVQDVYRTGTRRVVAGRIAQGSLFPGDEVMVLPSGQRAHVAELDGWPRPTDSAQAGDNAAFTFREPVIVERGDLLCAPGAPAQPHTCVRRRHFLARSRAAGRRAATGIARRRARGRGAHCVDHSRARCRPAGTAAGARDCDERRAASRCGATCRLPWTMPRNASRPGALFWRMRA
jgi:bifunctional enzyme CysN/CysC